MKNKPPSGCSLNELAAIIAKATKPAADVVPPGWFTRRQLQEQWSCSETWAQERISAAIKSGVIECRDFAVLDKTGSRRPMPHYSTTSQK